VGTPERVSEAMAEPAISFCRVCHAGCGILVSVVGGRPVRVTGDPDNPIHRGFSCPKGRRQVDRYGHPERLLHSLRRADDGGLAPVQSAIAIREIAERLSSIVDRHGARAVASYTGTAATAFPAGTALQDAWMRAIGSPMSFTVRAIDQPGKYLAAALTGSWDAARNRSNRPMCGW
jgi:anaerobic selenocysteine-containing dehydrogenase